MKDFILKVADFIQKIQFYQIYSSFILFMANYSKKMCLLIILLSSVALAQQMAQVQEPTCSSRVISLVPKTLKYHNEINNTKQLTCKSASLPNFASLDQRCYLIISPSTSGDFPISVNMTVTDKKSDGTQISSSITLPYILTIQKIRYNGLSQQQVEYDISLNRIIKIETQSTSWLLKPGQQFFAQFTVNQTPKIYERVFYQFVGLPNGLKGNQLTGVIEGSVKVPPGYYSFAVRVFDLEGNSQTLEATILVHDDTVVFQPEDYEDEQTLKARFAQVNKKIADNAALITLAKNNIEKKLELISVARAELSDLKIQQRKLEGTEKSLSYAMTWTRGNLENMKRRLQSAEQLFKDFNLVVNDAKRTYQTSVFAIQEKQSQIEKEQLQADRRFELYLEGDKNYSRVRLELDECETKNQKIANDAMDNLKELDRANFVQNVYDIIQTN